MKLTQTQWEKTAVFLSTTRPLEQAMFHYQLRSGPLTAVIDALAAFQNDDGGFGHGLEPDLQLADSSVLATTVALQHLRALNIDQTHPLIQGGVAYLENLYDPQQQAWPFVPETVVSAPRAPWWQHDADYTNYWHNPRPEVVGYLLDWGNRELAEAVLTAVLTTAQQTSQIEFHGLYCYLRLLNTPSLPQTAIDILQPLVQQWAVQLVETNPEKWGDYGLRPLAVAPRPDHFLADQFATAIEHDLDHLINTLQADGAWHPAWSWGEAYPDVWPKANADWKGVITLNNLLTLRAYDRLPDGIG